MRDKTSYRTKQKELLYAFLKAHPEKQYSAKEITALIKEHHADIGESTVYRLIKNLTDEGVLRRFSGKNAKSVVYQFAGQNEHCHEHFHLKCTDCGELIHLDCELLKSFEKHMGAHHGFSIDPVKTIFYGVCASCGKSQKKEGTPCV